MIQTSIEFPLAPPKGQLACVLKMLIENDSVSERETPFNGFRSRISELRNDHGLNVRHTTASFVNQFNHKSSYRKHYLFKIDREKAIQIYNEINK